MIIIIIITIVVFMVGWILVATRIVMMLLKMPTVILSGPSEPIIEVVRPIPRGLDISWRTDVTSKQDKYIVVYTRNDTGQAVNIETTKMLTQLRDLYPGAGYKIQVSSNKRAKENVLQLCNTGASSQPRVAV